MTILTASSQARVRRALDVVYYGLSGGLGGIFLAVTLAQLFGIRHLDLLPLLGATGFGIARYLTTTAGRCDAPRVRD